MTKALRIAAAVCILTSGVLLFATDGSKLFAGILILGNLFALAANFREKQI